MSENRRGLPVWLWVIIALPFSGVLGLVLAILAFFMLHHGESDVALKRGLHDFIVDYVGNTGSNHHSLAHALGWLGTLVGFVWLVAAAFSVSVGWGFVVALVPCVGPMLFASSRWNEAMRPFLCWAISWAVTIVAAALNPVYSDTDASTVPPDRRDLSRLEAPNSTAQRRPAPPPVPTAAPLPPLDGAPVDLSTLMGRARKLADAWQPEAALLGIEATLVNGKVQAPDGATATITFGPSPFAAIQTKAGVFVVTYDKSGLSSGPAKGAPGKALAEPMCAPEGLLPRLADLKGTPYTVRYELDPDQRPAWLVTSPSQPKLVRAFDPQNCGVRASFQARGKH